MFGLWKKKKNELQSDGSGRYETWVARVSFYQPELLKVYESLDAFYYDDADDDFNDDIDVLTQATLAFENNKFSSEAVSVKIRGSLVGYLPEESKGNGEVTASAFRQKYYDLNETKTTYEIVCKLELHYNSDYSEKRITAQLGLDGGKINPLTEDDE
jgi:hypothetical protein